MVLMQVLVMVVQVLVMQGIVVQSCVLFARRVCFFDFGIVGFVTFSPKSSAIELLIRCWCWRW